MNSTELLQDLASKAVARLAEARPLVPMYIHLIISAILPIYAGAHASLSRPSSAAKPAKKKTEKDDADEEEEDNVQKMEGLSNSDAIMLPLTAGLVLAGLYFLITRYGAEMINFVMGWYFAGVGIFSVAKLTSDMATLLLSLVFPTYYAAGGKLYKVDSSERKAVPAEGQEVDKTNAKLSPLPGVLGKFPLPARMKSLLWSTRDLLKSKYTVKAYIATLLDFRARLTLINSVAALIGLTNAVYVTFIDRPWFLTNLQGFAVSYCALQLLSPTSFATGSLILGALFCYDIWAVFFTPLMVTVAKNLDQPIKLVFPRPDEPGETPDASPVKSYSMLGLGDIVIPGIVIGLALRFDLYMFYLKKQQQQQQQRQNQNKDSDSSTARQAKQDSATKSEKSAYISPKNHWGDRFWTSSLPQSSLPTALSGNFPKPFFNAAMTGYVLSMIATVVAMSIFQSPQPALLYLVPGVLASLWGTGLVRSEVGEMWRFSEAVNGEQLEDDEAENRGKQGEKSENKDEKHATSKQVGVFQGLWNEIFGSGDDEKEEADPDKNSKEDSKNKSTDQSKNQVEEAVSDGVIVNFSITLYDPKDSNTGDNDGKSRKIPSKDSDSSDSSDGAVVVSKDGI